MSYTDPMLRHQKVRTSFFVLLICFGSGTGEIGCASARHRSSTPPKMNTTVPVNSPVAVAASASEAKSGGDERIALDETELSQEVNEAEEGADEAAEAPSDPLEDNEDQPVLTAKKHEIPFEFNQKVAQWIQYFSQKDRERFQRYLDRGEPYREVIENILEENQVPADLYYLGLIESGFDFRAKSKAKAVGVWQFMRATGKLYGLGVDSYVDERRDPIRATEAAAKLMRDLHREFHSWYLAMAAYNAGLGRIRRAVKKAGTHDFWELVARKKLPRETMEYVPKFLAARYIGEHPDLFAFYINEEKKFPNVQLVEVPSPILFESIEKSASIAPGTLSFVNPHYLSNYTHPAKKIDEIWVPEADRLAVEKNFKALEQQKIKVRTAPEKLRPIKNKKVLWYTVKSGDTLKSIAKKRGLSVLYLKQVNGLRTTKVSVGQQLKLSATSYQQHKAHPRKKMRKRKK